MTDQALTVRTTLDVNDAAAAKRTAQLLKHKGGLFPQDLTEAQAAILARLSILYGLDPLSDELIIFSSKIYLTLKGAMRLANEHPAYDGIECVPATPDEREAFRARDDEQLWVARVWRKDRRVPNVGYGRASSGDDQPVARKWTAEMAQKRAKHRALRDAFSLPVPGLEERDAPDREALADGPILEGVARPVVRVGAAGEVTGYDPDIDDGSEEEPEPIRNDQVAAIHAIGHAIGWITKDDDAMYRDALARTFHVASSKELTAQQAAAFIEVLVSEQEHMITEDAPVRLPTDSPRLRELIAAMDDGEAPDWPRPRAPFSVGHLRERAKAIGLTEPQLAGLIASQYGEGVGLETLDPTQVHALITLLSTGEVPEGTPLELAL